MNISLPLRESVDTATLRAAYLCGQLPRYIVRVLGSRYTVWDTNAGTIMSRHKTQEAAETRAVLWNRSDILARDREMR